MKIEFTGLRPGEKLYEELLADNEHTRATDHPTVRVMHALAAPKASWVRETIAWLETAHSLDDSSVRETLARLVPEYQPFEPR